MADDWLLTRDEQDAIDIAGRLAAFITGKIIGHGPARAQDVAEIELAIHAVQYRIAAQAWARAAPQRFRLLGEVIPGPAGTAGKDLDI